MTFRAAQPTFAGGEIAAQIAARYDTAKYPTALERGRDVLGLPGGGVYNRPGFEFCAPVQDHAKRYITLPFIFSTDQSYALEFGDLTMRVFSGGAPVIRPKLTITAIALGATTTLTIPSNGYEAGWDVYLSGIEGTVELNGMTGRVLSVVGDAVELDIDSTGFTAFTADTGGIAGNANGGVGGYAAVDPDAPNPDIPYVPTEPPVRPGLDQQVGP